MSIRPFIYISFIGILTGCSTKRNTVVSRTYHNITARFNGYYYSTESIKDGVFKIETNYKENYDKTLPVYIYPTSDNAKTTFPEFDKTVKKSTTCIQRHAIKNTKGVEIPMAGKWIDNNWINIGIARFYKREFFSGIEAFEYVVSTYTKSKDKYEAMLWLVKSYNEIGSVSKSEQILSLLKNEKKLPYYIKRELPALEADYFFRKGLLTEASTRLMEANRNNHWIKGNSRKKRARYSFIIAQMMEEQNNTKRARKYYQNTIKLKPKYEMVFYSKIKLAQLLDVKRMNSEKTKKDLLKMAKEFKNTDYYDVIYYTLGEIEEKENNTDKALKYYQASVKTSLNNQSQKALSYLKIGEINFDKTNYTLAQQYYDSTLSVLPRDHSKFKSIMARQKTLNNLVEYLQTISREDSLQRVAKMSDSEKVIFIEKLIAKIEADEERAKAEKEAQNASGQGPMSTNPINAPIVASNGGATFYFYNPNTVAFGVSDFVKKWGNRKNEDNWRRANKTLTIEDPNNQNNISTNPNNPNAVVNSDPRKSVDFYLIGLPITDSLLAVSNATIIEAFYLLGTTYKEELNNYAKAIIAFEELNARYSPNKYQLNSYFQLYRANEKIKNSDRAEYYKKKILKEYPKSEFAQMIKNPKYSEEKQIKTSEVEEAYTIAYNNFQAKNYVLTVSDCDSAINRFGKNAFLPKFEYIKALSIGKLKGIDSLELALKRITILYPSSDITPLADNILASIKKQKSPEMFNPTSSTNSLGLDTFQINLEAEHFIIAITPDDPKISNTYKLKLDAFCKKYYSAQTFNITSSLFGTKQQLVILKSFPNALDAAKFQANLQNDKEVFGADVKPELVSLYSISVLNVPMFYKKQNPGGYLIFYTDNYKTITNTINQSSNKLK